MKAQPIVRAREVRDDGSVVEIVIWRVPVPVHPCRHFYKYRLYYGAGGVCRVRYDNERGKGDHRHIDGRELSYGFESPARLVADFRHDVEHWRPTP